MPKQTLQIDDVFLHYHLLQHSYSAPTILILHGWGSEGFKWLYTTTPLSEIGYNIYIPDLPGFGETELPRVFTLDDYAILIEKFITHLGLDNIILIGHSNGGRIATRLMTRNNINVKKLILCASAGVYHAPSLVKSIYKLIAQLGKPLLALPGGDFIRTIFYKLIGGYDYLNCNNETKRQTFLNMLNVDKSLILLDEFKNIKVKTTIIWGDKDTYTPIGDAHLIEQMIPDSELIILDNEPHGINVINPERLFKTIWDTLK